MLICDANGVQEGAAMWLYHVIINKTATAVLDSWLSTECSDKKRIRSVNAIKSYWCTYPQVVNFLLKKCTTDEVIVVAEPGITCFAKPSGMMPFQYGKELDTRTFQCKDVYEEYTYSKSFIQGLEALSRHSMIGYWGSKKEANWNDLFFNAIFLLTLQRHGITF